MAVLSFWLKKRQHFDAKIISVGNLVVGGVGKTPLTIALAQDYKKPAIVLRGYKRKTSSLIVVDLHKHKAQDVGDEALEYARSIDGYVIVSKDRKKGIERALDLDAGVVFLDDGFRHKMNKFDILIEPLGLANHFCLPSGAYRLPRFFYKYAHFVAQEGRDFVREVSFDKQEDLVIITAIANPKRLQKFAPNIPMFSFADHHFFTQSQVDKIMQKTKAKAILTTNKDRSKLENFGYKLCIMELKILPSNELKNAIKNFKG